MTGNSYDIVAIGDFRFPGGTGSCLAEQIRAQAAAGYRTALMQVKAPVLGHPYPFNPAIRQCIDQGLADLVHPDLPLSAGLALAYHPQLFTHLPDPPLKIDAGIKLVVVNHPLVDGYGAPYYDWADIHANAQKVLGAGVLWAPVGPQIRVPVAGLENPPPFLEYDWLEVLDLDAWACAREGFCADRPVIGRHSRPDPMKWPEDPAVILAAYPDDPACRVRILGAGPFLADLVGHYPANWDVLPFNSIPATDFLGSIDFFVYFHHSRWVEAFGRAILEAMASGALAILPRNFEILFGEAAVYGEPWDVKDLVARYYMDFSVFRRHTEGTLEILRQRFGHAAHVGRIENLIGRPRKAAVTVTAPDAPPEQPRRVLFLTSNSIGMGHLTRMLAVARRLGRGIQPVFATMSQAMRVVREQGFLAEYIPFHRYLKCDPDGWNHYLRREINEMLSFYGVSVLVFDGTVAYGGLVGALNDNPTCLALWCRRAMWGGGRGMEDVIKRESAFHGVIEPGEIAAIYDRGLTTDYRSRTHMVDPIRLLDDDEMLDREEARAELGLEADGEAVLVQLGSGNNFDYGEIRSLILDRLLAGGTRQVAVLEWMISDETQALPEGARNLRIYPVGRYLKAFDFVVSAAGYNAYHELLLSGTPSIFIPNENPTMDEQLTRARYAEHNGLGLCLRTREVYKVHPCVDRMLDPGFRAEMSSRCAGLNYGNGAQEVARFVEELVYTRRADREPMGASRT